MKTRSFVLCIFSLILMACAPAVKPLASQNGIEIDQAWIRLPGGAASGSNTSTLGGYMVIKNTGSTDDSLVGAQADFAGKTMFHESSVDGNAVATMKMLTTIDVPAGQTVKLMPGGLHLMFIGLKQDVKVGDKVILILEFKKAGTINLQVDVMDK